MKSKLGEENPRAYVTYFSMKARTKATSSKRAYYYDRGITICPEWKTFPAFLADMGERPEGMTLERIDNDKGYSKENCRWASMKEQSNNRRSCVCIEHAGERLNIRQWATKLGINDFTILARIRRGWKVDKLFLPTHAQTGRWL